MSSCVLACGSVLGCKQLTEDKGVVGDLEAALLGVCWEARLDGLRHRVNLLAHRLEEHPLTHAVHSVST